MIRTDRPTGHGARVEFATDEAIAVMAPRIRARAACAAAGLAQASWYRRHRASPAPPRPGSCAAPVPRRGGAAAAELRVHATGVARRAGRGIAVLVKVYAHCIDEQADAAYQRITDALGTQDAGSGSW